MDRQNGWSEMREHLMFLESVLGDSTVACSLGANMWLVKRSLWLLISLQSENTRCLAKKSFLELEGCR
jgi:hypothetical protein